MTLELKNRWLPCKKCQPTVYFQGILKILAHKKRNIHRVLRNRCQSTNRFAGKSQHLQPCPECQKRFPSKAHLEVHHLVVHQKNKSWVCSTCSKKYPSRTQLTWHLIMAHTKEARFECTRCPAKFVTKTAGRKHLQEKHGI